MAASPATPRTRRPRHHPRESEREILAAAEQVLREVPYREITVEAIMCRTGLKRPAFYAHFRDRNDIVLRVVQDIGGEFFVAVGGWLSGSGEPRELLREAIAESVAVYARHGPILRALADAAPADAGVEAAYRSLVEQLVEAVAERFAEEQRLGAIDPGLDAGETARALVWMNERYLYEMLGRRTEHPALVARLLQRIWLAVVYRR